MVRQHKHKGVVRSDTGALRLHPITQKHKDTAAKRAHAAELATFARLNKKKAPKKPKQQIEEIVEEEVIESDFDGVWIEDGHIYVDLTKANAEGLRVKFLRHEGRKKRTVGLEIKK